MGKGEYRGHHIITHVHPRAKSYFCKDLESGRTYLRNQDHIKLDPTYKNPETEAKTVKLICDCIQIPKQGILKKPGSSLIRSWLLRYVLPLSRSLQKYDFAR